MIHIHIYIYTLGTGYPTVALIIDVWLLRAFAFPFTFQNSSPLIRGAFRGECIALLSSLYSRRYRRLKREGCFFVLKLHSPLLKLCCVKITSFFCQLSFNSEEDKLIAHLGT